MSHSIRQADSDDLVGVMRLFDGALLDTDPDRIRDLLTDSRGCILVAGEGRPIGAVALVTEPEEVDDLPWPDAVYIAAIAVRNERRGRGIGRSLIAAAADRAAPRPLAATFDERVRPFYTACGFAIEDHEGRLWGLRPADGADEIGNGNRADH